MTCLRSLSSQEAQSACDKATRVNRNDNVAMVLNSGFSPVHTSDYFNSSLVNDIANVSVLCTFSESNVDGPPRSVFKNSENYSFASKWKQKGPLQLG